MRCNNNSFRCYDTLMTEVKLYSFHLWNDTEEPQTPALAEYKEKIEYNYLGNRERDLSPHGKIIAA